MKDYIEQALRTKSTQFHGDKVELGLFIDTLRTAISTLQTLDKIKKSLFYGKTNFVIDLEKASCESLPVECLAEDFTDDTDKGIDVLHAVLGIATEAGELLEAIELGMFGEDGFDLINVAEEIGDIFWYQAILANSAFKRFEDIQQTNIAKLRSRFPDKFDSDHAINRDLTSERAILEKGANVEATLQNGCYEAPEGWQCTRVEGHEGPCATIEVK